jgi:basic amino acid/polyamine antiporter, APA family
MDNEPPRIELKRALGPWAAAAIVVGSVIGSGIFLVPKTMILRVGDVHWVFAVWILGGLLSLAGALTYAELAAALPEAGGEYTYLREAYGPMWGFIYSWTQLLVGKSGTLATLATGFFVYLANFFPALEKAVYTIPLPIGPRGGPLSISYGQLLGIVLILILAWLNYCGVKLGGDVQVAVTLVKVALIAAVILAGLALGTPAAAATAPIAPLTFSGFIAALVAALWAYDGWNNVSMVSSEIRNPQKNLPRSLIGGTLVVIAVYLLANMAYFRILSPQEVAGGERVAADMMRKLFAAPGASAVSIAAMISIFAALNGALLSGARVPYAAARQGYLFPALARVHPRYRTPGVSVLALSLWACVLVLSGKFDDLFNLVIFASWILYGMTAASVFVLRRKRPDLARPYRTFGYPVVPVLFVIGACILIVSTAIDRPRESLLGIGLILLGLPFYRYWSKKQA